MTGGVAAEGADELGLQGISSLEGVFWFNFLHLMSTVGCTCTFVGKF